MTYSGYPVLHRYLHCTSKTLTDSFPIDRILSRQYDQRCIPANLKSGLTIGMALTEKQGGSDVRANTTKAYCDNSQEKRYVLIGHKYRKKSKALFSDKLDFCSLDGSVQHR